MTVGVPTTTEATGPKNLARTREDLANSINLNLLDARQAFRGGQNEVLGDEAATAAPLDTFARIISDSGHVWEFFGGGFCYSAADWLF